MKIRTYQKTNKIFFLLVFTLLAAAFTTVQAQVVKEFKQRTSPHAGDVEIYHIKGDFQMIGNTNLMPANGTESDNGNILMKYVDVDGDAATVNSSSATLTLPTGNDSIKSECSTIVYAGLYWLGRAHDGYSPNSFTVEPRYHNTASINGYTLLITSQSQPQGAGTYDGRVATYTFTPTNGGASVVFRFNSWARSYSYYYGYSNYTGSVTMQVGDGEPKPIPGVFTRYTNTLDIQFDESQAINTGAQTVYIASLRRMTAGDDVLANSNFFSITTSKLLKKNEVKLKYGSENYTTVSAHGEIYYPTSITDVGNYMYAAYADVTEYVQKRGIGAYTVADMALREGNGGGTGYFGGWGMIVVYENSKMKHRDITIFDGYAYVPGTPYTYYELSVSGFKTAQNGDINMKLGIIAGEGDRSIAGDVFQIRNHADNQWISLSHSSNETNFFGGYIPGANPRNPERDNNSGIDIAEFEINNANNFIITNDQTSTKFRYGNSDRTDTYIIPVIAMAVDAYVPDMEAFIQIGKVNGEVYDPASGESLKAKVLPGGEVEYTLELRNPGNEVINEALINIPIPYNASLVEATVDYNENYPIGTEQPYTITEDGVDALQWNIGTIPIGGTDLLAVLTFKLKVTDDCSLLVNSNCDPTVIIDGTGQGVGEISEQEFHKLRFIHGYKDGECEGEPIIGPLLLDIDVTDYVNNNCGETEGTVKEYRFCWKENVNVVQFQKIKNSYPKGTRFWSAIEEEVINDVVIVKPAEGATEYTVENNFPGTEIGSATYYALPQTASSCYWEFKISIEGCNFWMGGTEGTPKAWDVATNWTGGSVPNEGDDVEFATVDNYGEAAVDDLEVPELGEKTIGNLINATDKATIIPAGSSLTVSGTVTGSSTDPNKLQIRASDDGTTPNGSLILAGQPCDDVVMGTVQMFARGYQGDVVSWTDNIPNSPTFGEEFKYSYLWQYFGVPVASVSANPTFKGSYVRKYNENLNGPNYFQKWEPLGNTSILEAFAGYELTQKATKMIEMQGALQFCDKTLTMTRQAMPVKDKLGNDVYYGLGYNIFGNSFTSAINISKIIFPEDPTDVEKTVYLYNTGRFTDWANAEVEGNGQTAGSYITIPQNTSEAVGDNIPSMQGFLLKFDETVTVPGEPATVTLKYADGGVVKNTKPQLVKRADDVAPQQATPVSKEELSYLRVNLVSKSTRDVLWLFSQPGTTENFDNGWDGRKFFGTPTAFIYTETPDGPMQVHTNSTIDGTYITLYTNKDTEYTLTLVKTNLGNYKDLVLQDLKTGTVMPLTSDSTVYKFTSDNTNNAEKRFLLSGKYKSNKGKGKGQVADDSQLGGYYIASEKTLVLDNNTGAEGMYYIYGPSGVLMASGTLSEGSARYPVSLKPGAYTVRLRTDNAQKAIKVLVNNKYK